MDIRLINKSELARKIGVSHVTVAMLLIGHLRTPRRVRQIASTLGVTVEQLKKDIEVYRKSGRTAASPSNGHGVAPQPRVQSAHKLSKQHA